MNKEKNSNNFIKKISFIANDFQREIHFKSQDNEIIISYLDDFKANSFDLKIEFNSKIKKIRMPNYEWATLKSDRIIPQFCNQIIQLENGFYLQPDSVFGIWEFFKKEPNVLLWRFNPENSSTITNYQGDENSKIIKAASFNFPENKQLKLLFSNLGALELSRSKMPFVAIACFTDHCDFDTLDSVQKQRTIFKEYNIKTTKGFFLNHFSKRYDNISWENESDELKKWTDDGHELAYHSLSQSLKQDNDSLDDFYNFQPDDTISTWIDHGYQIYNLSMFEKNNISKKDFSDNITQKKISTFWNYIDSGTATSGVINQLNPKQFTLNSFFYGIKKKPFKSVVSLMIKNIIYHFYNNELLIQKYLKIASSFKKVSKTKSITDLYVFVKNSITVLFPIFKVLIFWNSSKNKIFRQAKYSPIFFEHTINHKVFNIFQTVELLDFISSFDKESIDKLIDESGLFIGHTYFSVPLEYHEGKIFNSDGNINQYVAKNFAYFSKKIINQEIWNPTVLELVQNWKNFNAVVLELNNENKFTLKNKTSITYREIN